MFYIIILLISLLFSFYNIKFNNSSHYKSNTTTFNGVITDYAINEDKINLTITSKENLYISYYFKNIEEYQYYQKNIKYGQKVKIKGSLLKPSNNTIPNNFNFREYLLSKKIFVEVNAQQITISHSKINLIFQIKNKIINHLNRVDQKGYLKAFILGNKKEIKNYSEYQELGISHLFAISGMHITFIVLFLSKILKTNKKNWLIIFILIFYGFIIGYSPSIKRCLIFLILTKINLILNLKINSLKLLLLTISIIIFHNPYIIFNSGFIYSIMCVFGLIYSQNYFLKLAKLKTSFLVFLFSMPLNLYYYHTLNILSIIYNIIYIPLISIVIFPLAILSSIITIFLPIFNLTINILEKSCHFLITIKFFTFHFSLNLFEVIIFYIILLLAIKKRQYTYYFLLLCLIAFNIIYPFFDKKAYIYYFDVKQGDSTLIITPYRKEVILIDTGGIVNQKSFHISDNIINFLQSQNINQIDYLILSHGDYDHIGETLNILNNINVDMVIFNNDEYNYLEKKIIKKLAKQNISYSKNINTLNLSANHLYFLATKNYDNENDNSNVIYLKIYNYQMIFMGDAGIAKEKDLLQKYNFSKIDFLKVGHHGSKTSSSEEFIAQLEPQTSIISVGKNNRYGHPHSEVIKNLIKSKIYRTDINGSIELILTPQNYKIKTFVP